MLVQFFYFSLYLPYQLYNFIIFGLDGTSIHSEWVKNLKSSKWRILLIVLIIIIYYTNHAARSSMYNVNILYLHIFIFI